jgi:hypothetical protein
MSQPLAERVHPALPDAPYTALRDGIAALPTEADRARVESAYGCANGYAWGRQDEAGVTDTEQASRFALAYAWHALCYVNESWHMCSNPKRAWVEFLATGTVTGA